MDGIPILVLSSEDKGLVRLIDTGKAKDSFEVSNILRKKLKSFFGKTQQEIEEIFLQEKLATNPEEARGYFETLANKGISLAYKITGTVIDQDQCDFVSVYFFHLQKINNGRYKVKTDNFLTNPSGNFKVF